MFNNINGKGCYKKPQQLRIGEGVVVENLGEITMLKKLYQLKVHKLLT